jgi:DNA-directed RNA polymerase subunit omega
MIYPQLDELLKHADNTYTLVIIAAKRARQIIKEGHTNDERPTKVVTNALEEIVNGKIKF